MTTLPARPGTAPPPEVPVRCPSGQFLRTEPVRYPGAGAPYDLRMRLRRPALALPVLLTLATATACGAADDSDGSESSSVPPSGACGPESLPLVAEGKLTVATDSPAYEPWFVDNDPTNGDGFESAVAYAVAERLGFSEDQVEWVVVPFNRSYKPGAKAFDFDVNQISISPERAEAVDFSRGYYSAAQAVIALKGSEAANATSLDDLRSLQLAAQDGTTSLAAITDVIEPEDDPDALTDTGQAKQKLLNGQVDAILADLPTAFYISAVEIPDSAIVGQFQTETGEQEEFGLLFEKGSRLRPCVDEALATLEDDGTLAELEQEWLSEVVGVPQLR